MADCNRVGLPLAIPVCQSHGQDLSLGEGSDAKRTISYMPLERAQARRSSVENVSRFHRESPRDALAGMRCEG